MKKAIIITLSLVFIFVFSGCTSSKENENTSQTELEHSAIDKAEEAVTGYEQRLEFITDDETSGNIKGWEDTGMIDEIIPVDEPIPDESEIREWD